MKVPGVYRGKPVVVSYDLQLRVFSVMSKKGWRQHVSAFIDSSAPEMVLDGNQLSWNGRTYLIADEPGDLAVAREIVDAVEARRRMLRADKGQGSARAGALASPRQRAFRIAKNVEMFAWVLFAVGAVAGVALARRQEKGCSAVSCVESRPFVAVGVGCAGAAAVQTAIVVMIAAYIQARTAD